ncbi:MAG: hypothetical protein R3C68_08485 [Myxococcota bacterium]
MGFLGLFGSHPLPDKKISKISKLACNPYAQPDVRMREMQRLLNDGSTKAMRGVLKRFAANASGHIADEDEKKWLEDALVEKGEDALESVRAYIYEEKQLTYALRVYHRLTDHQEAVRFFIEVLERYGPDDHQSAEAKLQLVWQLSEHLNDSRVLPVLVTFLSDHSDDICWAVMDLLERGQTSLCCRLNCSIRHAHAWPSSLPVRVEVRASTNGRLNFCAIANGNCPKIQLSCQRF